jgi:hypothetical protein
MQPFKNAATAANSGSEVHAAKSWLKGKAEASL